MRCQCDFQMHRTVLFHYRTDGCNVCKMTVVREGNRTHHYFSTFLESVQFVFKDIEADFQVLGIYNAEQGLVGNRRRIKRGINL